MKVLYHYIRRHYNRIDALSEYVVYHEGDEKFIMFSNKTFMRFNIDGMRYWESEGW